jgi:hypothetical protein
MQEVQDICWAQFQNETESVKEVMNMKGKCHDKIQKKINSMKVVVERWLLVPMEQTV